MYKRCLINAAIVSVMILGCGGAWATDVKNLKGMYSCFTDDYKELSVLEGAVAWERGVIRNLYDYAHGFDENLPHPSTSQDYTALQRREKQIKSPVVRLVREWFTYAGRHVITDFKVSKNKVDSKTFIQDIAQNVAELWVLKRYPSLINKNKHPGVDPLFGNDQLDGKRLIYLAALWQVCGTDRDKLTCYNNEVAECLITLLFGSNVDGDLIKRRIKGGVKKTEAINLKQLLDKLLEKADGKHRPDMSEKEKMANKIKGDLKKDILVLDGADAFLASDFPAIKDEVLLYQPNQDLTDEQIEKLSFVLLAPGVYPPVVGQQYSVPFKKGFFPDCMEHAMRLFINHMLYDEQSKRFHIDRLQNVNPLQALSAFYAKHFDATQAGAMLVHEDWAKIISNIPLVSYSRVIINKKHSVKYLDAKGYVKLPQGLNEDQRESLQQYLQNNGYTVVDDTHTVYEVLPTVRNVIIILNYFFNLGLFTDNEELIAYYISPTFIKDNLDKVFTPFGSVTPSISVGDLDKYDETTGDVRLTIAFNPAIKNYDVTMVVQLRRHGFIESPQEGALTVPFFNDYSFAHAQSLVMDMLVPFRKNLECYVESSQQDILSTYQLISLLTMPLYDQNSVSSIIQSLNKFPSLDQAKILKSATIMNNQEEPLLKSRLIEWARKLINSSFVTENLIRDVTQIAYNAFVQGYHSGAFFLELLEKYKGNSDYVNIHAYILDKSIDAAREVVDLGSTKGTGLFQKLLEAFQGQALYDRVFNDALESVLAAVAHDKNLGREFIDMVLSQQDGRKKLIPVRSKILEVAFAAIEKEYESGVNLFSKVFRSIPPQFEIIDPQIKEVDLKKKVHETFDKAFDLIKKGKRFGRAIYSTIYEEMVNKNTMDRKWYDQVLAESITVAEEAVLLGSSDGVYLFIKFLEQSQEQKKLYAQLFDKAFKSILVAVLNGKNVGVSFINNVLKQKQGREILIVESQEIVKVALTSIENGYDAGYHLFVQVYYKIIKEINPQILNEALQVALDAIRNGKQSGLNFWVWVSSEISQKDSNFYSKIIDVAFDSLTNGHDVGFFVFKSLIEDEKYNLEKLNIYNQVIEKASEAARIARNKGYEKGQELLDFIANQNV